MIRIRLTLAFALALAGLGLAATAVAQDADYDPPTRVGRLAYVSGEVSIAPNGSNQWSVADRNRPLTNGDRLWSGSDGRVAMDVGGASVRADRNTAFDIAELNDQTLRVVLSQGTLNLSVRRLFQGQTYEVDTPTLAFVPDEEGSYRIDIDPDGNGAMVTVFRGSGTAWGANDARRNLEGGYSYRFDDVDLRQMARNDIPYGNDFDRFCADLDSQYNRSESARYVADNVVGYDDLDRYGSWTETTDYGAVWYPTTVAMDWAPYRFGHWAWIAPWGWTWIDNAPWGYAPFHYGRWALIHDRWGWVPGPRLRRAVYAPALVVFTGSTLISVNGPIGWFPLGPRDVYLPPYRVSRNYFVGMNMAGGRFFDRGHIAGLYTNYRNPHRHGPSEYAYRYTPRAVTRVPHDVFTGARPVGHANERVTVDVLQRAPVLLAPTAKPIAASYAAMPRGTPPRGAATAFGRDVVTRVPVSVGAGVPRALPGGATAPAATRVVRQPTLPERGITVERHADQPIATLPRAQPVTRGGVMPQAPTRSVYTPSAPRDAEMTRTPSTPRAWPRPIVREAPTRSEPVRSEPTRSIYTPREAPEPVTRSYPSTPRAMPRAEPMRSEPTRSIYTPREAPEPIERSYPSTPRAMPRAEPMQPMRSEPMPREMPRTAPRDEPAPQHRVIQLQPAAPAPVVEQHDNAAQSHKGGLVPRGRPAGR